MALSLFDNIKINTGKPVDSKYLNSSNLPYTSVTQVNSTIPIQQRYLGLTVNINNTEYWYAEGVTDIDLIPKSEGNGSVFRVISLSGLTVNRIPIAISGSTIIDDADFTYSNKTLNVRKLNSFTTGSFSVGTSSEVFLFDFNPRANAGANDQVISIARFRHRNISGGAFTGTKWPLLVAENSAGGEYLFQLWESGVRINYGTLVAPTTNRLEVNGASLLEGALTLGGVATYNSNKSSSFTKHSLVDKHYVTGITSQITGGASYVDDTNENINIGDNNFLSVTASTKNITLGFDNLTASTRTAVDSNITIGYNLGNVDYEYFNSIDIGFDVAKNGKSLNGEQYTNGNHIAIGYRTMSNITGTTSSSGMIAIGMDAMANAIARDGGGTIAIGNAFASADFELGNIGIGGAGTNAVIGRHNILIGALAGANMSGGTPGAHGVGSTQGNIAIGVHTLEYGAGNKGTFVGTEAGSLKIRGQANSGFGNWSLPRATGDYNNGLGSFGGYHASLTLTGSTNTFIGWRSSYSTASLNNTIVLAHNYEASLSNKIYLGSTLQKVILTATPTPESTSKDVLVRNSTTGEIESRKDLFTRHIYVDDYGAVGNGVSNDSAAIQLAINAAGSSGTIYFTKGKTYIIDETIELPIALGMIGHGAILKRKNAIVASTTQSALINATAITVNSTSDFKIGDPIILCDITLPYGGRGYEENSATTAAKSAPHIISSISGNTITLSTGLRIAMPSGSTVVKVYDMFNGAASTLDTSAQGNRIIGLEFDGNVVNNNHTNSWVFNKTIDNLPTHSLIEDCTFHDIPAENIFISNNTTLRNNRAYDLNGSFVHVSQAASPNMGFNNFIGNKLKNICIATNDVTDHSEGAFTMSAGPHKIFCSDNYVDTCSGSFFSPISDLSNHVTIINNKAFNCDGVTTLYNFGGVTEKAIISNNIFENCGWLQVTPNLGANNDDFMETGRGHDHVQISDNIFVNIKLRMQRASQFSIINNEFITTSGHTYSTTDEVSDRDATISLTRCTQYIIDGNTFDNRAVALDTKLVAAINCEYSFNSNLALAQPIKTSSGTSTEYCYYNRNVKVTNNKVHNYRFGIMDYYPFSEVLPARSLSWIAFDISNNLVTLRPSGAYGIVAGPGTVVHNNKIYSTSTTVAALRLLGVNDGSGTTYNTGGTQRLRLNGTIAYNNTVIGANKSIEVGSLSVGHGNNTYNCQVYNNFIDGTVVDNTSGNSTIGGSITLVNESLALQVVRQNPEFY